jgi:hypothetical protein
MNPARASDRSRTTGGTLIAAHALHPHIQQNQVRRGRLGQFQRLITIMRDHHLIIRPHEMRFHDFAVHPVIIHNQNQGGFLCRTIHQ